MAYNVIVSPDAQKEIENAVDFYASHSDNVPHIFIKTLIESYHILSVNPYFTIRYKNIRSLKLKRFPFSLYFIIDEKNSIVPILSCFHNKRNPINRPKSGIIDNSI
jgi:toxin ParE1/3/4